MSTQRITVGTTPVDIVDELSLAVGSTYELENVSDNMIYFEEREDSEDPPTGRELGKRLTSRYQRDTAGGDVTVQAGRRIWVWSYAESVLLVDD